jgi:hypothetical protein
MYLVMKLQTISFLTALAWTKCTRIPDRGLNLPPTQGTTRDGAFFPGKYQYEYHPDQVTRATSTAGFSSIRLAVNVETANDLQALQRHKAYIDAVGGRGIICMFDTSLHNGTSWPRSGRLTGKVEKVAEAWQNVHRVFASYGENVMYEIFNEPWGYKNNAVEYVADMKRVIELAQLPHDRCILAGLYGSADVQSVARAGWSGNLAYHTYVFWLPEGSRTREKFSERIQQDLANLSSRVFITEFGVGLDGLNADIDTDEFAQDVVSTRYTGNFGKQAVVGDWQNENPALDTDYRVLCEKHPNNKWCKRRASLLQGPNNLGADVAAQTGAAVANSPAKSYQEDTMAFLRGLRDALLVFKKKQVGVKGLFHWHGWHNGDTWDFWDAANARSSRLIQMIMVDLGESTAAPVNDPFENPDPYMSEDFVKDEQSVHMVVIKDLGPPVLAACPAECAVGKCQTGSEAQIGGKHTTGNFCTHNCSVPYSGMRYCGAGADYATVGAIDCSGCARPARCAGLPCWSEKAVAARSANKQSSLSGFLAP